MSIRAYKIIEIRTEKAETFNLWHDNVLCDFLEGEGCFESLNMDGCGLLDIDISILKEALKLKELPQITREALIDDIMVAEKDGRTWLRYYCF